VIGLYAVFYETTDLNSFTITKMTLKVIHSPFHLSLSFNMYEALTYLLKKLKILNYTFLYTSISKVNAIKTVRQRLVNLPVFLED